MKNSMIFLVTLTVLAQLMFAGPVFSEGLVVDGLFMLKNNHAARSTGMGAAFVSIDADPNAVACNPANAVGLERFTASFGHTEYWKNIRFESGYFGINLTTRCYLHGGIRYAADNDLELRSHASDEPEGYFNAHDASFKAGLSYKFSDMVAVGAAMGWFIEEIEGYRGSAFNIDFGVLATCNKNLNIGASVTNLGSDFSITKPNQLGSRDISLPTAYRLGASYRYSRYLGAVDFVYKDNEAHLHLGAEACLQEMFQLRVGYMTGYDTKNFTAGASFKIRDIIVDYAFLPYTNNLGTSHLFNLTFSL
ncbi:MAG: PorV/PorQ family protein [candidate division Zixibacteria bacterium]|nr:PorV/PorQ family protein [candidate division Zixibacteria bacterium]